MAPVRQRLSGALKQSPRFAVESKPGRSTDDVR